VCRLSIVIPFLGETEPFEDSLVSVLEHRPDDCEVLVVHRGGYDDPYDLSDEVGFVAVPNATPLAEVLNAGFRRACGEVLHVLLPGVRAPLGWTDPALEHFDDPRVAAVTPVIVDGREPARIASAGIVYTAGGTCRLNGVGTLFARGERVFRRRVIGPTASAAFYRRMAVEALGGYCPQVGSDLADADLALSLRDLGFRNVLEPNCVVAIHVPQQRCAPSFALGRDVERVYWRHADGTHWLQRLMCHPPAILAGLLSGLGRLGSYACLCGRVVGLLEATRHRRHQQELAHIVRQLWDEQALAPACSGGRPSASLANERGPRRNRAA
jgi:cellulose synthase/poly-beta-1,6-N-acetylglucosamine synthase-like glycosyltransferase